MERILAWKLLPRVMMAVICYAYLDVLNWFMTLPPEAMKWCCQTNENSHRIFGAA